MDDIDYKALNDKIGELTLANIELTKTNNGQAKKIRTLSNIIKRYKKDDEKKKPKKPKKPNKGYKNGKRGSKFNG
ncbi:hypothetical protein [Bacillus marasmi]|uniref:hypothetical protein n=1 Tax=Bacillus marasmi TaxID=1926279 RepID=UPI0011CCB6E9|nr:hypothetical protein [Bacillus marasmi]